MIFANNIFFNLATTLSPAMVNRATFDKSTTVHEWTGVVNNDNAGLGTRNMVKTAPVPRAIAKVIKER